MSLASEYRRQFRWREWRTALGALPPLEGTTVLDLGCGVGDVAAALVARGARVIGIDANEELVQEARSRNVPTAEFRTGDLRGKLELDAQVDGLWCSFTAAYFPDLPVALAGWARHLKQGGWIAVTEVDDLFGHEPLGGETKALLNAYAEEALAAGRYDFHMGRKLEGHLRHAGLVVPRVLTLADQELSFSGRAQPEVLEAWRNRFARMTLLRSFCGARMLQVEAEFVGCLGREDHRSLAKVYCCIAGAKAALNSADTPQQRGRRSQHGDTQESRSTRRHPCGAVSARNGTCSGVVDCDRGLHRSRGRTDNQNQLPAQ